MVNLSKTFQEEMPFEFESPRPFNPKEERAFDAIEHALMALRMMAVDRGLEYGEGLPEFEDYKNELQRDRSLVSEGDVRAIERSNEKHHEFWLDYVRQKGAIGGDEPGALP